MQIGLAFRYYRLFFFKICRLIILFIFKSNFADYGKVVTSTLAVSPNRLTVTATSTEFVISTLNPNLQANYWWVETAPLHFGTQFGFAVWAYLQTGSNTTDKVIQAVVEIAPPPLGIVSSTYVRLSFFLLLGSVDM